VDLLHPNLFYPLVESSKHPLVHRLNLNLDLCAKLCAKLWVCLIDIGQKWKMSTCLNMIFWKWSMPFTWDTRKEIRFFTYFQWTRKERKRTLFYTMIHGMSTGSLKMNDLKSCRMIQISCIFPTKSSLYGTKLTTSKHECLTLTGCTSMSHFGTSLLIRSYLTHVIGLRSCSLPWLT
jgi:hypothetical protein